MRAVADAATSLAALMYGGFLGAFSAMLLVHLAGQVAPDAMTPLQRAALGLVAWLVSTWFFSRNANGVLIVFRRAFALAALLWGGLGLMELPEPVVAASTGGSLSKTGAAFSGDAALIMAGVCLAAWALCRWSSAPVAPPVGDE